MYNTHIYVLLLVRVFEEISANAMSKIERVNDDGNGIA